MVDRRRKDGRLRLALSSPVHSCPAEVQAHSILQWNSHPFGCCRSQHSRGRVICDWRLSACLIHSDTAQLLRA